MERIEHSSFQTERFSRAFLGSLIEEDCFHTLVAVEGDEAVGYGSFYSSGHGLHRLISLAVLPQRRGQGIGSRLLRELEGASASSGARGICLEVATSNPVALRLYVSRGYQVMGMIRDYYGDGKDAYYMEKELDG
jgi:ribosomal-protein-alanine N-acetyltransferase